MSDLIVPGKWKCDKCGFMVMKQSVHVASGSMTVDHDPTPLPCPNDGEKMRAYSWKEEHADTLGAMMRLYVTNQVQEAQIRWLKGVLITHHPEPQAIERKLNEIAEGYATLQPAINPTREAAEAFWRYYWDKHGNVKPIGDIEFTVGAINNALRVGGIRLHDYGDIKTV